MSDSERDRPQLPVPLSAAGPRPSLQRNVSDAAFVSQLIAARDRLPVQRERRRASAERAVGAYRQGASMTQRRMPLGFRKTILA